MMIARSPRPTILASHECNSRKLIRAPSSQANGLQVDIFGTVYPEILQKQLRLRATRDARGLAEQLEQELRALEDK